MNGFLKNLWRRNDGAVLVYTAILLPVFIGFIALGLDVASWHLDKRNTQTMADAAALAAAYRDSSLEEPVSSVDPTVETAANDAALLNGLDEDAGETITVNKPPLFGDTVGEEDAIEVIIRTPLSLLLSALVDTNEKFASSRAVALPPEPFESCIWALNETADGAITVSGNANVQVGCGVYSASNSDSSIQLNGSDACLTATAIIAVGGVDGGASSCYVPDPDEGATFQGDPLSGLPEPDATGCDYTGTTSFNNEEDGTLSPGVYCGNILINTQGTVTFEPGIYILDGASLTINGQATVVGDGVTIFLTENSASHDNVIINGGADVNLSAPTTGDYQGILFFSSPNAADTTHTFNGGSDMNLEGVIYFPSQDLSFTGGSDIDSSGLVVIADEINFSGNSNFSAGDFSSLCPLCVLESPARLVE